MVNIIITHLRRPGSKLNYATRYISTDAISRLTVTEAKRSVETNLYPNISEDKNVVFSNIYKRHVVFIVEEHLREVFKKFVVIK